MDNPANDQTQLDYLLGRANSCLKSVDVILKTLNKDYPVEGCRWVIWENQVDCVSLGDLEWESFEEPNAPAYSEEKQELILRR